jgi:hypothetical protein
MGFGICFIARCERRATPPKHPKNLLHHIFRTQQHVIIPEPQHTIALTLQRLGAPLVVSSRLQMLTTIQLNH